MWEGNQLWLDTEKMVLNPTLWLPPMELGRALLASLDMAKVRPPRPRFWLPRSIPETFSWLRILICDEAGYVRGAVGVSRLHEGITPEHVNPRP